MTQAEEQAHQLISEAEKKMSPRGFFQTFFGGKSRIADAIDCYQRAGNLFKLAKNWAQAGATFQLAASLSKDHNNRFEAANNYVLAAKCLQKIDLNSAITCLLNAIQIYADIGRFVMAAKIHFQIGEIYEANADFYKAIQHYEQAADYFKVEDNVASAKRCLLKVAQFASSEFNDYDKAFSIYEEIAFNDVRTPMMQFTVKDNLLKAVLCQLCIDVLNAKYSLEAYASKVPFFDVTREFEFLRSLIEKVEESDEQGFAKVVKEFDDLSRLDTWHTKVLLRIKKQINEPPDLL